MIVKYPDKMLRNECSAWSFQDMAATDELTKRLEKGLEDYVGFGLSAIQIGIPVQAFAIKADRVGFVFNPKILNYSEDTDVDKEGCLSLPGVVANIRRAKEIRVRFQDETGEVYTTKMVGLTARIFQHEYDHLQGKLIIDKLNRYHRDKALKGYNYG